MQRSSFVSRMLAAGGDQRIRIPAGANTNQYGSSPYPRSTLAYASSTANDISLAAFVHLESCVSSWPEAAVSDAGFYRAMLESLRARMRWSWQLDSGVDIVFAPSGTDLEYVALALAGTTVSNILLGRDEVGSGCILAAGGRYFAAETARLAPVERDRPVAGFERTRLHDLPVRDERGRPLSSRRVAAAIARVASRELELGRACLAHMVFGSKTGLLLPDMADLAQLRRKLPDLRLVVDACQARIEPHQVRALLDLDCMVLLTGSKFMGGPPFSGMALVPPGWKPRAPLAEGLATIFRRAEWPAQWSACDFLPDEANPGLLLRLEAAQFELERFRSLAATGVDRVVTAFRRHVTGLAERLGAPLVAPCLDGQGLHRSTLATLDLTALPLRPDLVAAQRLHRVLAARGLRLGQPVKCLRLADGRWGGTLRVGLSMPLIVEFAGLADTCLDARLAADMDKLAEVISATQRPIVA